MNPLSHHRRARLRSSPLSVSEVEALRLDAGAACADLDLLVGAQLRAEVDLDTGQDERLEAAEHPDPRLLEVGREDRVVHVAHRVAVPQPGALSMDEREAAQLSVVT